jgi:hypothetical protein
LSRFRALLLGVAEYDDPGIQSLPCVISDLSQVGTALAARGYAIEHPGKAAGRVGRTQLRGWVREYLGSGRPGDTLVVYLSGHGVYRDGMTYLVPTDADLNDDDFAQVAVPLDAWARAIDESRASGVLFMVDACREGFSESKSVVARTAWSAEKIARSARRQEAWIFPCAEGQVARYVHADGGSAGDSFSLFSRSVVQALADPLAPATLDGFAESIRSNMASLTREYGKPPQEVRVEGNGRNDVKPFVLFPAGAREPRSWEQAAADHPAWRRFTDKPDSRALRASILGLIRHLARARHDAGLAAVGNPWDEGGAFALRMTGRMSFLLDSMLGDLTLSPAEAALLVAAPFMYDTYWSIQIAKVARLVSADRDPTAPSDELGASFGNYLQGFPGPRRTARLPGGPAGIDWWLLSRWLAAQPGAYAEGPVAELLQPGDWGGRPLAVAVVSPARVLKLIRAIRADDSSFTMAGDPGGLLPDVVIQAGQLGEQQLRERLIGMLVVVAHRLAIEAPFLPDVLAGHLDTGDPVDLTELRATLEEATWAPLGHSRILTAACGHPAVDMALREHVAGLDRLLTQLHAQSAQQSLGELRNLPVRVLADQVGPAKRDGHRAYDDASTRFRLASGPLRELLAGERPHGSPSAAICELYRNAADACRYRKARTEYLNRTGRPTADWAGSVRLVRGTDEEGRDYVDCTDNGIGMGHRELTEAFAHVGMRFTDLPEFQAEKRSWDGLDPPVAFAPASRRGTGVLSYFLPAGEITIDTCRLGLDGNPGERLRATITGPDALFRIQTLGPGSAAGTTVRLYLRPAATPGACLDGLRDVQEVVEFATEATEGGKSVSWQPGEQLCRPAEPGQISRAGDDADEVPRRSDGGAVADPGRPIAVVAEWALHGKTPGDHEGYRLLASSNGLLSPANFSEALDRFSVGTPDELPQVTVSYLQGGNQATGRYLALALAIHEYVDGHVDQARRKIHYTRYFSVPYQDLAPDAVGYYAMYRALCGIQLPDAGGPPLAVTVTSAPQRVPGAGELALRVAAMLLTGRCVCVVGAERVSMSQRLQFIDDVMALLPYGMRAKMAAATWVRTTLPHRFRLFFSDVPRVGSRHSEPDLVAHWSQPDQTLIPAEYHSAHEYLNWLEYGMRSPAEALVVFTRETGFGPESITAMLAELGVTSGAPGPGAGSARTVVPSAPAGGALMPPPDHAARIMLAIGERVRTENLRSVRNDITMLSTMVQRAQERGEQSSESQRAQYRDVIIAHGLLWPELLLQLGKEARPYSRALLWLAFGLPLSYQGYCQLEDCLGQAGARPSLPEVLLRVIRDAEFSDSRVAALVLAQLGTGELEKAFNGKQVDIADMVSWLAEPWDRPRHGRLICGVLVGYLRAMQKRYKPQDVHHLLRPHGYLAPAVLALYPEDLRRQVDVLSSVLLAASGGRALDDADVVRVLRGANHAPTWGLLCAVLRLLDKNPEERRLVILAQHAYFAGMLARSGEDIGAYLDRYRPRDVEEIFKRLIAAEPTVPLGQRAPGQVPPHALPPGGPEPSGGAGPPVPLEAGPSPREPADQPGPAFEPPQAQQPGPEENKAKRFRRLGEIYYR